MFIKSKHSIKYAMLSRVLLRSSVDDLAVLKVCRLGANLYVDLGLIDPPLFELDYLILPIWICKHVADLLRVRGPVNGGRVVGRHIPAGRTPSLELVQILLELRFEGTRGEVLHGVRGMCEPLNESLGYVGETGEG